MITVIISGSDLGGASVEIADATVLGATFVHEGLLFRYDGEGQAVYLGESV